MTNGLPFENGAILEARKKIWKKNSIFSCFKRRKRTAQMQQPGWYFLKANRAKIGKKIADDMKSFVLYASGRN